MDVNGCETKGSYGSGCFGSVDTFSGDLGGGSGVSQGGLSAKSQSLVLDSEKGELVKAPVRVVKKNVSEGKAMMALKNHSEAERRRRQRINGHLATLRDLVPSTDRMDKATLLAEVINQVKELKKATLESIRGLLIPMDSESLMVEPCDEIYDHATVSFSASLCCKYRPDLFTDLRQAISSLHTMKLVKMEISTLEDWFKIVLLFTSCSESKNAHGVLSSSIYQSLSAVLDKDSASLEYSARPAASRKKRKVSLFEFSSSSS